MSPILKGYFTGSEYIGFNPVTRERKVYALDSDFIEEFSEVEESDEDEDE